MAVRKAVLGVVLLLLFGWGGISAKGQEAFRIVTFNVENLCDTIHDVGYNDFEYLPTAAREWTSGRYNRKLQAIAEAISNAGGTTWPWLVALCEVENACVLDALLATTPLGAAGYRYTISCSDDPRGMDVALLYLEDRFRIVGSEEWTIPFTSDTTKRSRNILYVEGRFYNDAPLDLLIVHLPSRRGGAWRSRKVRNEAMTFLAAQCDSLLAVDPNRSILILGDFNATPYDRSSIHLFPPLGKDAPLSDQANLYDITTLLSKDSYPSSYYYGGITEQLDRFIVSRSLLDRTLGGVKVVVGSVTNVPHLSMRRLADGRSIPLRTYGGTHYLGGVSDHLAVSALFFLK